MTKASLRQAMLLSQGRLGIFWADARVAGIGGLAIVLLLWPLRGALEHRARTSEGLAVEGRAP